MSTAQHTKQAEGLERLAFPFSEEQLELREAVLAFAKERLAPGAGERDRTHTFPTDLIGELAEMGLMGAKVAEERGGPGADNVAYALLLEALAEVDASCAVVVAASNLVANVLVDGASEEQQERWLRPLAEGELGAASFCLSEPETGSDAGAMKTHAVEHEGGYLINGSKMWATSGAHAGLYLVFAKTEPNRGSRGVSAFVVEKGAQGLQVGKEEEKMGQRSSGTCALFFDDCFVPAEHRIGPSGLGYRLALGALGAGRVGISGLSLGIAEAAFQEGLRYATERKAFGQSIAGFQNSQFVLADCRMELDQAWLMTLRAARLLDTGYGARMESSMAKVTASEVCGRVVDKMLQLHGGYGYSEEYPIERYYRDARVTRIYEGTNEIQRVVIARELLSGFEL